jgi:Sec-independent protein translocase protein TatA
MGKLGLPELVLILVIAVVILYLTRQRKERGR